MHNAQRVEVGEAQESMPCHDGERWLGERTVIPLSENGIEGSSIDKFKQEGEVAGWRRERSMATHNMR